MSIGPQDLEKLSRAVKPEMADRTLRLLRQVALESLTDRDAVLWGHRLQQDHSDLVSQTLALSQDDLSRRVAGYVNRMADILTAIDVTAVCGVDGSTGMLSDLLRRASVKIDTVAELHTAQHELGQLVTLMGEALDPLLQLKATIEQHSRRIDEIAEEAEAAALAAELVSERLRRDRLALSHRFLERSISLTQTVAQIRSSAPMRAAWIEQPLRLISTIQTVALVTVPGWLAGIASVSALQHGRSKATPTDAGELDARLRKIVQLLNT